MTNFTKNDIPDLTGRIAVVTGANSGLGFEISLALAEKGALVVMACRSLERGQKAAGKIREQVPAAQLDVMRLDLASLDSIREFADAFLAKYDRLDVLINNGGPVVGSRAVTKDGFESHFGINHLGHFALTGRLLEILRKTPDSRVVSVTSRMHAEAEIHWDDLNSEASYDRQMAYKQSKLANILFAFELSRRLGSAGAEVLSAAAHPGLVQTGWADNNFTGPMRFLMNLLSRLSYQKAEAGALSVVYAAVHPEVKQGGYYGPNEDTRGYPVETRAGEVAYDEAAAKRLWEKSEELTGVTFGL